MNVKQPCVIEYVHMQQRKEYWWNPYIETSNKCKRKRTDIVTWDDQEK